ncbi:Odorant receptor 016 [Nylanderia fulva]|uniref:Odorant receptor n=1 Tax=Nylanderia fulva TaxID=613905 RepID=A0A6G1LQ09_9HYME|nr:odorant receptor 46a-like [Nylanderia fulva]KAF3054560.1 Odorant receptor 016 [Nylanderia fulva]
MNMMEFPFKVLTICGCWQPQSWTSVYKHIYRIYTILILLSVHTFTLSQLMDIILIVDNTDDFCDNLCILVVTIMTCFKMFSLLANRKNIIELTDILMKEPCKPFKPNEIKIFYKFDKDIQVNTFNYTVMSLISCASFAFTSFFTNFSERKLMFRAWLPFEYSSMTIFCLAFVHQLIASFMATLVNVGCDSLIFGLLANVCCQFEILTYRLKGIMLHSDGLRNCVEQHCKIFKLAFLVNSKFRTVIGVQFLMSMFVVCFNLYEISILKLDVRCIRLAIFMTAMLTQIFIYCWYGNQVRFKSRQFLDNLFEIEWFTLDNNLKKSLLIMMERTVMPIEITSAYTISVNLDSFIGVLKTSYSAYNLLRQMNE